MHNGIEETEKIFNTSILITELIAWVIFIAFLFASYFGLKYAHTCEIQDKVINIQNEIINQYRGQSIMVNDYIKKGEVKVLRPKRWPKK